MTLVIQWQPNRARLDFLIFKSRTWPHSVRKVKSNWDNFKPKRKSRKLKTILRLCNSSYNKRTWDRCNTLSNTTLFKRRWCSSTATTANVHEATYDQTANDDESDGNATPQLTHDASRCYWSQTTIWISRRHERRIHDVATANDASANVCPIVTKSGNDAAITTCTATNESVGHAKTIGYWCPDATPNGRTSSLTIGNASAETAGNVDA